MSPDIAIQVRGLKTAYGTHVVHEHLDPRCETRRGDGHYRAVRLREIGPAARDYRGSRNRVPATCMCSARTSFTCNPRNISALQRLWGIMFQDGALFSNLTVRENVMVPMKEHTDLALPLMKQLADQKIRMSGLETWAGRKFPSDLSGGMRKRAALARALALDPPLLFLDEPTAGLDPITAAGFDQLIRDLQSSLGLTVFLVTHDVDTLAVTCDRIAVLGEKKVLAVGTMDELRKEPHPWIQDYFGGPRGRGAIMGAG